MKTKFLLLLMFVVGNMLAQTERGRFFLSGNSGGSFSMKKTGVETKDKSFEKELETASDRFTPSVGYFVLNNLLFGASVPVSYEKAETSNSYEFKRRSLSFNPFTSFYLTSSGKVKPFVFGEIGLGKVIDETKSQTFIQQNEFTVTEEEYKMFSYKIGLGVSYFFKDWISADIKYVYGFSSLELKDNNPNEKKSIVKGSEPVIGFSIYF